MDKNESGSASENSSETITKEEAILLWVAFCESKNVEATSENFFIPATEQGGRPAQAYDHKLILYNGRKKIAELYLFACDNNYPNADYINIQLTTPYGCFYFEKEEYIRLSKMFHFRSGKGEFKKGYNQVMNMALGGD